MRALLSDVFPICIMRAEFFGWHRLFSDRDIETWNPTGKYIIPAATVSLRQTLESLTTSGAWSRQLHASVKNEAISTLTPKGNRSRSRVKKEENNDADETKLDQKDSKGLESLRKTFGKMSMKAVKRVTPDRIYSLAVHPTTDKDLVFIGDRKGWLGIWNATADEQEELKDEEDEEDEYDRNAFVHRVYNDHGTISCLRLDPLKAHTCVILVIKFVYRANEAVTAVSTHLLTIVLFVR